MIQNHSAGPSFTHVPGQDQALPQPRIQPIRALRAFRCLIANKEDTTQVFEIMQALNGGSTARSYQKLLSTVRGGKLAYARLELAERFSSSAYLTPFPDATVGAAYRRFMALEQLSAQGLAEESRKARGGAPDVEHPLAWFGRRIRDVHDVWHVLTGYGRDSLGELCLVAFSYAQTGSLGWAFIAVGGVIQSFKTGQGLSVARAVWEAYRNGRAAVWLPAEDYDALFAEPLEGARRRLGVRTGAFYFSGPPPLRNRPLERRQGGGALPGWGR